MSDETVEAFRAMTEESKRRRRVNTQNSVELLRTEGIDFRAHNGGAHLILEGFDFWPSTGWQKQQEINLCYVATTRAKSKLVLIEE